MAKIKTGKDVTKLLPVWAQDHIKDLERERDLSLRALNDHLDQQKPSPIFVEKLVCTGEESGPTRKRLYVQSTRIEIEHSGISCRISCDDDSSQHDEGIRIVFHKTDQMSFGGVCMLPTGPGEVTLLSKNKLRD